MHEQPSPRRPGPRKPGVLKGQIHITEDFDALPEDFKDYMTAASSSQPEPDAGEMGERDSDT